MHHTRQRRPTLSFSIKLTSLFLLLLVLGSCASRLSKGDKRFEEEQFERAIELYKQALANADNKGEVNYRIAE